MNRFGRTGRFLIVGGVVGVIMPFFVSVCLFGTTLQSFVAPPPPTAGYWSGAPTPVPTAPPGPLRTWTGNALSAAGGVFFILWSVLGALAGEALALRRWGNELSPGRYALLGAATGSLVFIGITLCGFLK